MSTAARLAKLEQAMGASGDGCPACGHLPPVVRVKGIPRIGADSYVDPPEGAGVCSVCGSDRTCTVRIVLVEGDAPRAAVNEG